MEKLSFVSSEIFTESKEEAKLKRRKTRNCFNISRKEKFLRKIRSKDLKNILFKRNYIRWKDWQPTFLEHIRYATEEEIRFAKQRVFQEYASYFGMEKMEQLFSERKVK